jgi:hypothetical protein
VSLTDFLAAPIDSDACRIWPGALNSKGYGCVTNLRGGTRLAHRAAYEMHVGPIPDGMTIDHLCREKRCVNPRHMEPVTTAENIRRANAVVHSCKAGHPLSGDNLVVVVRARGTQRECLTCRREQRAARLENTRAA